MLIIERQAIQCRDTIQLFTTLQGSQTPWEQVIIGCFGYACHVPTHQGPILCALM